MLVYVASWMYFYNVFWSLSKLEQARMCDFKLMLASEKRLFHSLRYGNCVLKTHLITKWQVLVSIQSLILVPAPYFNEPVCIVTACILCIVSSIIHIYLLGNICMDLI